jgi:hypothetical protein
VSGLSEQEREALWDAIERAFLDTTTWDRASEEFIDDAVERVLADRLAAHEAREARVRALADWWGSRPQEASGYDIACRDHARQQLRAALGDA